MRVIILFLLLAGCAHTQEMHPLQVQNVIASLCQSDIDCIQDINECFDGELTKHLSDLNVCEKEIFCGRCPPDFEESTAVMNCWFKERQHRVKR